MAAAAAAALTAFNATLTRIGFAQEALVAMNTNQITSTASLIGLEKGDVEQLIKIIRGGQGAPVIVVPFMAQRKFTILCYWVNRRNRLGESIAPGLFSDQAILQYGRLMAQEDKDEETGGVKAPAEYKTGNKWKPFKEGCIAFFNTNLGMDRVPFAYVIRPDAAPGDPQAFYPTEHARLIAITPHQGLEFDTDNGRVFDHLKSWTLNGPAWTWIRSFNSTRNGRAAWLALIAHYEGDAQRDRVIDAAYTAISQARYFGDRKRFSFETFVTIHQDAYEDLEQYGQVVSADKRVRDLLQGIKDTKANAAKETILANVHLRNDFTAAVTHLATSLQLQGSISESNTRNVSGIQTGRANGGRHGRGRGNQGRGNGRGGRGRGRNIYLGSYTPEQWTALSREDKQRVRDGRANSAVQSQGRGTQNVPKRQIGAITVDNSQQQDDGVSAITMGTPGVGGQTRQNEQPTDTSTAGNSMSRRQRINALITSKRCTNQNNIRQISQLGMKINDPPFYANCELDSHADTSVAGPNFTIIEYTDQVCDVSPFSKFYEQRKNIPIVKAATAYDDEKIGVTYILILGQALHFGDEVETSLLCPNQMRSNGVIVDDVPVHLSPNLSSTHSLIFPEEDISLPLKLNGSFSYIPTRTPTLEEIETCKWLILTNDMTWEPHKIPFQEYEEAALVASDKIHHKDFAIYSANRDPDIFDNIKVDALMKISALSTGMHQPRVTASKLAKRWAIGESMAAKTLQVTTQKGRRNALLPVERRFRTKQAQLRYPQLGNNHGRFYTDTFFSSVPAIDLSSCCQIFTNDLGFTKAYPMRTKSEAPNALKCFIQDVGIPQTLHSDNAKELMQGDWKKICNDFMITTTYTEPNSPWQNRAEGQIRETKRHVHRKMRAMDVPKRLWSYCVKWSCDVRNKTAGNSFALEGRTPYESIYGNTPDISSICEFEFYEPIWYYDHNAFPEDKKFIGRWLGEAHNIGQAMCYWILTSTGKPIARSTIQSIPENEMCTDKFKSELKTFDESVNTKLTMNLGDSDAVNVPDYLQYIDDDNDVDNVTPLYEPVEPEASMPEADDYTNEAYDKYISAEVLLPKGNDLILGKVIKRKRDDEDVPIGIAHNNPIFDTRLYQVQFPEGQTEEYSANVIAQNLYSQLDSEGHRFILLDEILDYRRDDDAIPLEDRFVISNNGNIHKRRTTKGWHLCIKWKDGSTSWEALKDVKESFPIQVAEFAISRGIHNETAFAWWVKDTLARKNRMVKAMKTRYIRKTHKYGIQLPKTIQEAYELDKESNTDYWHKAIIKEMTNNSSAFKFLDHDEPIPVGSKWIPCHMIFDVKVDLTRKARLVAGGHWTDPPSQATFSTVVSRDSVRIAFLIAALNDIEILSADIGNAYLNAPTKERVHTTAGPEFGPNRIGQTVVIVKALYGLKSSGAAWHSVLAEAIHSMGFQASLADPDVWYREATKEDGFEYYEYLLIYVDDILALSHKAKEIMKTIERLYRLKEPAAAPTVYLGSTILEWSVSGDKMWAMSSQKYVKEAIRCLEVELSKSGQRLIGKPVTPMTPGYRPELDVSPLLEPDQASYYMSLIGILRWAVELGRIDIYIDVTLLSSFMAQPRLGHMNQVLHIFNYLKHHENSKIVFDPYPQSWDESKFQCYDWTDFYRNAQEPIPPNQPPPRGNSVQMNVFVDADHAGNRVTRRSHTGILIYLNSAPIIWYSKAQSTVETSTFGSEFIAMKIAVEMVAAMRYKLRMFGIPINGPANVFCDNQSVVTNSTVPDSTLRRKHNAIAYHRVRESVAAGTIRIAFVHSKSNNADILTKPLSGPNLRAMISNILLVNSNE